MQKDDVIYRRAALDAISCNITVTGRQNAEVVAATIGMFADRIKALPSAQPEIIMCKDCKHRPTPTRADEGITYGYSVEFPDKKCPCQCEDGWYNHYPDDDFYCGYAERWEE